MSAFCGRYPTCGCKTIGRYCHVSISSEACAIMNEEAEKEDPEEIKRKLENLATENPFNMKEREEKPLDIEEYKRNELAKYERRHGGKRRGPGSNFTPPKKKRKKRN
jgi:hypothetical protein